MSQRLRVLYVAHSVSDDGGMEQMGRRLLIEGSANLDFTVIASEGLVGLPSGVRTVRLALPRRPGVARIVWFYWRSAALIRRLRSSVDLVHTCGAVTTEPVDLATVHFCQASAPTMDLTSMPWWRRWNYRLARSVATSIERHQYSPGRVRRLVSVSPTVDAEVTAHYGDLQHCIIANGVALDEFLSPPRTAPANGPLRLVMVAGDFVRKGVDLVLECLQLVDDVNLTVVGPGPIDTYRRLVQEQGLAERVSFTGRIDDLRPVYAASDVVVCMSSYEPFGLYLVEAALSGCAVVGCDVGVTSSLVGNGEGGVIVSRSAPALAEAIQSLNGDRAALVKMGVAAREHALEFSSTTMTRRYVELYEEMVKP